MAEQSRQIRVIALVVDYETRINRRDSAVRWHFYRVTVSSDPVAFLIYRDGMTLIEKPGRRHTSNAGPDHSDVEPMIFGRLYVLHWVSLAFNRGWAG